MNLVTQLLGAVEAEGSTLLESHVTAIDKYFDDAEDSVIAAAATAIETAAKSQKGVLGSFGGGLLAGEVAKLVPTFDGTANTASANLVNEIEYALAHAVPLSEAPAASAAAETTSTTEAAAASRTAEPETETPPAAAATSTPPTETAAPVAASTDAWAETSAAPPAAVAAPEAETAAPTPGTEGAS